MQEAQADDDDCLILLLAVRSRNFCLSAEFGWKTAVDEDVSSRSSAEEGPAGHRRRLRRIVARGTASFLARWMGLDLRGDTT